MIGLRNAFGANCKIIHNFELGIIVGCYGGYNITLPNIEQLNRKNMDNTNAVTAKILVETTTSWDGSAFPTYPSGQPQVIIKRFSFPPHAVTDWHTHPVINAGIVISGQLTIVCRDGEEHTFHAGDALCEISNRVHRGENRSDLPADIVVFYASTPGAILAENSK
jgi:quercetin dioxygenase-like cupin family protein